MLAPRGAQIDVLEDEDGQGPGEADEGTDGQVSLRASLEASAIGLSAVVDGTVPTITATATWGEYSKRTREIVEEFDPEEATDLDRDDDPEKLAGSKRTTITEWLRTPRSMTFEVPLDTYREESTGEERGVQIRYLVRPFNGNRIVSVFLDNLREVPPDKRPPDEDYLYQPRLELTGPGAPFLPRRLDLDRIDPDPDIASADLIYRNRIEFAAGHGVAAGWDEADEGERATKIFTEIIPAHEVPKVTPRESDRLSMDFLGSKSKDIVAQRLEEFLGEYETWIDEREAELESITSSISAVGFDHVKLARKSLKRMRAGVDALDDPAVFKAFRFANRAMALQRRHTVEILAKRRGESTPTDIKANWRPFQVGFILQALPGLADPSLPDRDVADLLWFPTGGGKTEAYLGLTAFTLAHRRLRSGDLFNNEAGTAVIMRYTLRLLTIQQFQRALTLIAACEHLRAEDTDTWGKERFTIGLWVGQSVTPNNYEDAKTALNKLRNNQEVYDKSPYQVLFCPWCGDDLTPQNYVSVDEDERTYIKCPNLDCDFSAPKAKEGIPALVVDSEIYRHPPSLLLATVDKFAQMAWNGRIQSLFGRVERHCARHGWISAADDHPNRHAKSDWFDEVIVTKVDKHLAPPDLIIQDELHLIAGPLGTLVGLYESAVDALCSYDADGRTIRPKVVASTATVRRASTQVSRLFDRETAVFPPLGLDASDSFFATETKDEPGRLYVGVFGPGRSIKSTLVRVYGAMLGRAKLEFDEHPSPETDSYMTLVGYFNSLRELGGAVRLVADDVRGRLRTLQNRGFSKNRIIYQDEELTSRKGSSRIADTLDHLQRTFMEREHGAYPIDVLLASNMISVGVDIDRLGLMVVSGQPKRTAEYIQATSRVGRVHPGLIIQVYNWVRPRDISHYERFHHFHDTFYRHVEATSVTPFSERARDRALPAVLVAYNRLAHPNWSKESGAAAFDPDDPYVQGFSNFLIARARRVTRHGDDIAEELDKQLENLIFQWEQATDAPSGLIYSYRGQDRRNRDPAAQKATLLRPMELDATKGRWAASGSLREVEEEVPVVLIEDPREA